MNPNKREHYIPQFFQKNFSKDRKIVSYYYKNRFFVGKICRTLQVNCLYDQIPYEYLQEAIVSGYKKVPYLYDDEKILNELRKIKSDKKYLEKKLGHIEVKASNVIRDLIEYKSGSILRNRSFVGLLLSFIFELKYRSKKQINRINNISKKTYDEQTTGMTVSERISFNYFKYRMMANNLINLTTEEQNFIKQASINWDVSLCINNSNTPFVFGENSLYEFYEGKELLFPISSSMAILFQESKTNPLNIYKPDYIKNNTYSISSNDVKKSNYLQCLYSMDGIIIGDKTEIEEQIKQINNKVIIYKKFQSIRTKY